MSLKLSRALLENATMIAVGLTTSLSIASMATAQIVPPLPKSSLAEGRVVQSAPLERRSHEARSVHQQSPITLENEYASTWYSIRLNTEYDLA